MFLRSAMDPTAQFSSSPSFYKFGAVCCLYYISAQLVQELTFHLGINDSATGESGVLQRLMPLDQFRLAFDSVGL